MSIMNKIIAALICLIPSSALLANVVAAKKDGVEVYKTADKKSAVLSKLQKGEEVEALERKGMYWKVKANSAEGFVSVMNVRRVASGNKSLSKAIQAAAQSSRTTDEEQNTRARSAVMGVRGLSDSDTVASAGNVSPNTRVIYAMEDLVVSQEQLDKLGDAIFAEVESRTSK